jgi:hypothetical protein
MREQVLIDFEGTEDCRLERVPSMDMKRRTLCQISSNAYHSTGPEILPVIVACPVLVLINNYIVVCLLCLDGKSILGTSLLLRGGHQTPENWVVGSSTASSD